VIIFADFFGMSSVANGNPLLQTVAAFRHSFVAALVAFWKSAGIGNFFHRSSFKNKSYYLRNYNI
jgi:hypothetical protein